MGTPEHGLHYRGFTATIFYDEDEGLVLGHVPTTRGAIEFTCTSVGAVEPELHRVVDAFLAEHPEAEPIEPKS